eukprot:TRINITY_DN16941_c0_g1_i3.p1 TRINITY_DN16941_c0_g1~~TRINITY_DN16941_c0_g1_i3.p1  ORF type:complete len:3077 (+),score=559.20 TRINITY_DN16941_c0_g1_i3:784-10014(+)
MQSPLGCRCGVDISRHGALAVASSAPWDGAPAYPSDVGRLRDGTEQPFLALTSNDLTVTLNYSVPRYVCGIGLQAWNHSSFDVRLEHSVRGGPWSTSGSLSFDGSLDKVLCGTVGQHVTGLRMVVSRQSCPVGTCRGRYGIRDFSVYGEVTPVNVSVRTCTGNSPLGAHSPTANRDNLLVSVNGDPYIATVISELGGALGQLYVVSGNYHGGPVRTVRLARTATGPVDGWQVCGIAVHAQAGFWQWGNGTGVWLDDACPRSTGPYPWSYTWTWAEGNFDAPTIAPVVVNGSCYTSPHDTFVYTFTGTPTTAPSQPPSPHPSQSPSQTPSVTPFCVGGPIPGTATPDASFAVCNTKQSGQVCVVDMNCNVGYVTPPQVDFVLDCDFVHGRYNASAISDCVPLGCATPLRVHPGANYSECFSKKTGDTCKPTCPPGHSATGTIQLFCSAVHLSGRQELVFDVGDVGCRPNQCAAGAAAGTVAATVDPAQLAACSALATGQRCAPGTCAKGRLLREPSFELLCGPDQTFNASAVRCDVPLYPSCSGGPLPGTASVNGSFAACNALRTGDTCGVSFRCATGYESPIGAMRMDCDPEFLTYNASAAGDCTPLQCRTPLNGAEGASYAGCAGKVTGDTCELQCADGYHPNGTVTLTCSDLQLGGTTQYVYDAGAARCLPNSCASGPRRGSAPTGLGNVSAACTHMVTGQRCEYSCLRGYVAPGGASFFELLCAADGTFNASAAACIADLSPSACTGGPIPGTASPNGSFAACNTLRTGAVCGVVFTCGTGYRAPASELLMECDPTNLTYNASAAGGCTPQQCRTPLNGAAGASYADCAQKVTGDSCELQCTEGYYASGNVQLTCSELQLGGATQYVFDAGTATCLPNSCSAGPVSGVKPGLRSIMANCSLLATGQQCGYSCYPGFVAMHPTSRFELVCDTNRSFRIPDALCVQVGAGSDVYCFRGPLPGTASPDADFAPCNARVSGQLCTPDYKCPIGHSAPQASFTLVCSNATNQFDASEAPPCIAKRCTAAIGFTDGLADYSGCYNKRTGDTCTPACRRVGYSPTGSFGLICSDVYLSSSVEFVFDVAGVGCAPDRCSSGPDPATIPLHMTADDFGPCLNNRTEEGCMPVCPAGFTLIGGQLPLVCLPDGTFDASRWSCLPPPPPPPPPGVCDSGVCSGNGLPLSDCTCECYAHWAPPDCASCPEPYREHLNCSLPAVPSLSVDLGSHPEVRAEFDLHDFLSVLRDDLPADSGAPQVSFVCALPAAQDTITEADRRSSACCKQTSSTRLCVPAALAGGARQVSVLEILKTVLDLELPGAVAEPESVIGTVASAAASVGVHADVAATPICAGKTQCGSSCVHPTGHCSSRGTVHRAGDGACSCECDSHFSGAQCDRCSRPGTTLCASSGTSLSVADARPHFVIVEGAWTQEMPLECACPLSPSSCGQQLRCVTRPAQSDSAADDRRWPACAIDNSTVYCTFAADAPLPPGQTRLFIEFPGGPEPPSRDNQGEADPSGMLPLAFVGRAATLVGWADSQEGQGGSVCGRTTTLALDSSPADWAVRVAAVDTRGTVIAEHFESTRCVPLSISVAVPGQNVTNATSAFDWDHSCPAHADFHCSAGGVKCGGLRGGSGTVSVRGLSRAGAYALNISVYPEPGSAHFALALSCKFVLLVLPGRAVQVTVDEDAAAFSWPSIQQRFSPVLVLRVKDALGNYVASSEGAAPPAPSQVYAWLTDANNTDIVTLTLEAGLTASARPQHAVPIAERSADAQGRAVFDMQIQGAAYGRAYLLHFSVHRSAGSENATSTARPLLVLPLSLPRCPGDDSMAVYGTARCVTCPPGLVCDGSHRTELKRGFWREAPWHTDAVACPYSTCVRNASALASGSTSGSSSVAAGFLEGEGQLCTEGASGVLCATCDPGWRMVTDVQGDGRCQKCGDPMHPVLAGLQMLAMFAFLLALTWVNLPVTLQRTGRTGQILKLLIETVQIARVVKRVPVVVNAMIGLSQLMPIINFQSDLALLCTLPPVQYRSSLMVHGLLPFMIMPFVVIAEQIVKQARNCKERWIAKRTAEDQEGVLELQLDQQVLAACSDCSAWGCHRCESCRMTKCLRCLAGCRRRSHNPIPVPLIGEGSRLRLPARYELLLGTMVGFFLVLPTMMEKFTDRWQCVTYSVTAGEGCSPLFPERCESQSRLQADLTVQCDDPASAVLSVCCMVGWGAVAAALLCAALSYAAARPTISELPGMQGKTGKDLPRIHVGAPRFSTQTKGPGAEDGQLQLPRAGLHSALALGAWRNAYYAYHKPYWWWESYIIVWKTSVFICFVLPLNRAFLIATLICATGTLLHDNARPYHDKWVMRFSLVAQALLSSSMLAALWVTLSQSGGVGPADSFADLDSFSQGVVLVVTMCSAAVLCGIALLFARILYQAVPIARQLHKSGEAVDPDAQDPEALHLARLLQRLTCAPPQRITLSDVEEWRARYEVGIPPLGDEEEYERLFAVFSGLLHQAARGPAEELARELRTPWEASEMEWYLAYSASELLRTKGAELPDAAGIVLLVLELYTMEGPDLDDKFGFEVPKWVTLADHGYSDQVRAIAKKVWQQLQREAAGVDEAADAYRPPGSTEPLPELEPLLDAEGVAEESRAAVTSEVVALLQEFRGGLLVRIQEQQAEYREYKKRVGTTRNPDVYRMICWALRTLQHAVVEGKADQVLDALNGVLRQGWLNFTMVLMAASRPVADLCGGAATLWRGLGNLPTPVMRWHRRLRPGSFVAWVAPTSSSFDGAAARLFATGRAILFELRGVTEGIPLWTLSKYPRERELLIAPFSRWVVESVHEEGPRLLIAMRWGGALRGDLDDLAQERIAAAEAKAAALLREAAAPHAAAAASAAVATVGAALLLPAPPPITPPGCSLSSSSGSRDLPFLSPEMELEMHPHRIDALPHPADDDSDAGVGSPARLISPEQVGGHDRAALPVSAAAAAECGEDGRRERGGRARRRPLQPRSATSSRQSPPPPLVPPPPPRSISPPLSPPAPSPPSPAELEPAAGRLPPAGTQPALRRLSGSAPTPPAGSSPRSATADAARPTGPCSAE